MSFHESTAVHTDCRPGNRSPAYHSTVGHAFESGLEFLKNALCADELMANDETHSTNWTSIYAPSIIHEILGLEYVNPSSSGKFILLIIVVSVKLQASWVTTTPTLNPHKVTIAARQYSRVKSGRRGLAS